jgi:hypothetical protein
MTLMISNPAATDVDDDGFTPPAFPPEHYGCPPWCTQNVRIEGEGYVGHDSAEGMPDRPGFRGYRHTTSRCIPYAAAWKNASAYEIRTRKANPLVVNLDLEPEEAEPKIALSDADENWTEFTLDEAAQLADEIKRMVAAYGRPSCPSWCDDTDHRNLADENCHYTATSMTYASAPSDEYGNAGSYSVALIQSAPEIGLCGGFGMLSDEVTLTLLEAAKVAGAITEMVAAARAAQ